MKDIIFISNILTPYQKDFFHEINNIHPARFISLYSYEENRDWNLSPPSWLLQLDVKNRPLSTFEFLKLLQNCDPGFVLIGGYRLKFTMVTLIYCTVLQIPFGFWVERSLPGPLVKKICRNFVKNIIFNFSKIIFCVGKLAYQETSMLLGKKTILPYSINVDRYSSNHEPSLSKPLRFLFTGQFVDRKGIVELLEAFSQICPKKASLTIAGSGPLLPIVQNYSNRYQHINHVGFLETEELAKEMSRHNVAVIPSKHDGWAVVVLEAMASSTAIISTRSTGAFQEFYDEHRHMPFGLMVEPTVSSLKEAIVFYCNDGSLATTHGLNGRILIEQSLCNAKNAARHFTKTLLHLGD